MLRQETCIVVQMSAYIEDIYEDYFFDLHFHLPDWKRKKKCIKPKWFYDIISH